MVLPQPDGPNSARTGSKMSISYGTRLTEAGRQVDAYAGRTLKGAKPADLPVVRLSKFELAMNAETARILGLTLPASLLTVADEVIE